MTSRSSGETRLLRRKARLTKRLMRRDQRRLRKGAHRPQRNRTILRARLYKIDAALDQLGYFDRPYGLAQRQPR